MKHPQIIRGGLVALALAGCGGGSSVPPTAGPVGKNSPSITAQMTITIPAKKAASLKPTYVSPATQSITVAVDGGTAQVQNLTPGSSNCNVPAPLASLTCTVPITVVTAGPHTFTFVTYDAINAGGNQLSLNSVSQNLVAGTLNNIAVVLQGAPVSFAVSPLAVTTGEMAGSIANGYTITDGTALPFTVVSLDADGELILGPGAPAISVTPSSQVPAANFAVALASNGNPNQFSITSGTQGTATLTLSASPAANSGASALNVSVPLSSGAYVTTTLALATLSVGRATGISAASGVLDVGLDDSGSFEIYGLNPATGVGHSVVSLTTSVPYTPEDVSAVAANPVTGGVAYLNYSGCSLSYVGSGLSWSTLGILPTDDSLNPEPCNTLPTNFLPGDTIAFDAANNVYVGDPSNCILHMVSPSGTVSTVAGAIGTCTSTDNPIGTSAGFAAITSTAFDSANGKIYLGDDCTIRAVDPSNGYAVTTLAGTPGTCTDADGTGAAGTMSAVNAIAYDAADGYLYVVTGSCSLRRVSTGGVVTTAIPAHCTGAFADGFQPVGAIPGSSSITYNSSDGHLYLSDPIKNTVREVLP